MKNTQRLLKSGPVKKDSVTEVLLGIANTSTVESFYEMPVNKCLSIKQKPIPVLNRITSSPNKKFSLEVKTGCISSVASFHVSSIWLELKGSILLAKGKHY